MEKAGLALINLLKGVVYENDRETWEQLIKYEYDIQNYFKQIDLLVYIDKSEGYAYLKQIEHEEENEMPRIIERRQLNFHTTLLCLLLRKYLLENDSEGTSKRAIIKKGEIIELIKVYLPLTNDEVKQVAKIETYINKIISEGFLRKVDGAEDTYEVKRIIKAFINADVVEDTLEKLKLYVSSKQRITD